MSSSLPSGSGSATGTISVPAGHVGLVLLQERPPFYLQIPLYIINSLSLTPRKYLLYLGWCILGVEGVLALEHGGHGIDTNGGLVEEIIYYYVTAGVPDLTHAVDTAGTTNASSTQGRKGFRKRLLKRDIGCVWTGMHADFGDAMHIIPFQRGSDGLQRIVGSRPNYNEDVTDLTDINDIRNGVFANVYVHRLFDLHDLAVMKTPNHILGMKDIPRNNRPPLPENVCYPTDGRFTLQWLVDNTTGLGGIIPNNTDAAFSAGNKSPKPSDLLLHYNYGVAAAKQWGRGTEVLKNRPNPRPPGRVVPQYRPTFTDPDRHGTIREREGLVGGAEATGTSAAADGSEESEDDSSWDAAEFVLSLWESTPAAIERRRKKAQEDAQRMEEWRKGVTQDF